MHLRAAIEAHKRRIEHDGGALPPGLLDLLDLASFRVSKGQDGSTFDRSCNCTDSVGVEPQLLTQLQAAKRLNVSLSTVKRLVRVGELPAKRMGSAVRVRLVDVDGFASRTD